MWSHHVKSIRTSRAMIHGISWLRSPKELQVPVAPKMEVSMAIQQEAPQVLTATCCGGGKAQLAQVSGLNIP